MFSAGPIDWPGLRARADHLVREIDAADLTWLRKRPVYLASPITSYLARGEGDLAIQHASEWQAWLLSLEVSSVSPALLTLPPLLARGDDQVGLMLQRQEHEWWMNRCLPWMEPASACVVPPIPRWYESKGVWQEAVWFAERRQRPVLLAPGKDL